MEGRLKANKYDKWELICRLIKEMESGRDLPGRTKQGLMLDSVGGWGALLWQQIQTSENTKTRMPRTKFYWAVLWLKTSCPTRARQSSGRRLDLVQIHKGWNTALILLARMLCKWCQGALHIVKRTAIFILAVHRALGTFQGLPCVLWSPPHGYNPGRKGVLPPCIY